jgi:transposase
MNREVLVKLTKEELIDLALTQAKQIEVLTVRVAELEAKLGLPPKTPDNSSKPPSQGQKANGDGMRRSKNKAHPGAHRPLHANPTRKRDVAAEHCHHCRADVSGMPQMPVQCYDRIEIPEIKPDVTRVTLLGGVCPCCAKAFKAAPPAGLEPGSPFGPNLRSFMIYLRFTHAISFERLAALASDLLGLSISEGALVNIMAAGRDAFARQRNLIRERLLCGTILQSDETSFRVGKKNWWCWVFHHADSACFVIRPSRGKDVVEEFLGEIRPEIWVSDRLKAQIGWATLAHQFCLPHLIRDTQFALDAGDTVFAPVLLALLKRACAIGRRRDTLKDSTLKKYLATLESRLTKLLLLEPSHPEGRKLQRTIKGIRGNLFVFLENRQVPASNNGSERALRPCTTLRKVINCFRSQWGATLYADVRSVIETARRRTIPILQAIRMTLEGRALAAGL